MNAHDLEMTMRPASTAWRPLLAGELARRANETIDAIACALTDPPIGVATGASIGGGDAGIALFFSYLARAAEKPSYLRSSQRHLEGAIESLAVTPMSPDLYAGFTGIAWAVEHLRARSSASGVGLEDPNEDIDAALESGLSEAGSNAAWLQRYDLLYGVTGLGIYALERLPGAGARRILELIVERLAFLSSETSDGITWFTPPGQLPARALLRTPEGYFNLGVAHGIPGVIAFLGRVCAAGVAEPRSRELLKGAVRWTLAQRRPRGDRVDFPAWVASSGNPPADRVSWCYGNPGIAVALLIAARAVGELQWEEEAIELARTCAERPFVESRVQEACLCHGGAGNGHLFHRLFLATGDTRFREVAVAWYARALALRTPGVGIAGYQSLDLDDNDREVWRPHAGFLTGIAGIGLALLAATTDIEPAWDRLLLADLPPKA
jgi:lantibiotic modifying enzyme